MKHFQKSILFLIFVVILIVTKWVPSVYRVHYVMCMLILMLATVTILIKGFHQVQLIPGVGKYKDEIDTKLVSTIIGNLYLLITLLLLVAEVGEVLYKGFIQTFIWFSIIPIAIYVRIMFHKINK